MGPTFQYVCSPFNEVSRVRVVKLGKTLIQSQTTGQGNSFGPKTGHGP